MQKALFALSLGFGLAVMAYAAQAQTNSCGDRDKLITSLSEKYGETRQSMGLARNNSLMELYASDETGTWTILVTLPDGRSCLIAAGNSPSQPKHAWPESLAPATNTFNPPKSTTNPLENTVNSATIDHSMAGKNITITVN